MLIHILMATCNGEKYLAEQLASIEKQTQTEWMLHIRDDASTDGTWQILADFASRHSRQVVLEQNKKRLGAKQNFAKLLSEVREAGDYAFCDQDDLWEPVKLEVLQNRLREAEGYSEKPVPALVYSDAAVIDGSGNVTAPSFAGQTGISPAKQKVMECLLLCNVVQGAASLWNQSLQEIVSAHAMPEEALMHDWWIALVAAGHGRIVYLPCRLLRYRQHEDNVLGGFHRREWHGTVWKKICSGHIRRLVKSNRMMAEQRKRQAEAYQQIYGDRRVERYLEIDRMRPRILRAFYGIREGYIFISKWYSVKYYLI